MKLSTRTRYGTRALLDIALYGGDGPVPVRDIAQRQQISPLYLVHLLSPLIAGKIIRSTRGARGGIWLARPPAEIKLSDVIGLLEGSITPVECVSDPNYCPRSDSCVTREVWGDLERAMNEVLESKTLQGLVEQQRKKDPSTEVTYYI